MISDADLDMYNIAKALPPKDIIFYFHGGETDGSYHYGSSDVTYGDIAEALAQAMKQDEGIESIIVGAAAKYLEE